MRKNESGKEDCLEGMIRENYTAIYQYCFWKLRNADDAQDITQEVFYRFIHNAERYREIGKARAYLYTIAKNLCKNWKKQAARSPVLLDGLESVKDSSIQNVYEESLDRMNMKQLLNNLSERQQEILLLRYSQELSVEEIAKIFGTSRFSVYYQIKTALKQLENEIKGVDEQ